METRSPRWLAVGVGASPEARCHCPFLSYLNSARARRNFPSAEHPDVTRHPFLPGLRSPDPHRQSPDCWSLSRTRNQAWQEQLEDTQCPGLQQAPTHIHIHQQRGQSYWEMIL
ncbi:hypothetical protein XENTR_v10008721 [Xenopus tropicalis]|nr:hypothetical protein XENTR_v10008721 [Xenopus tropicalis]